jgi:hypothetical protein
MLIMSSAARRFAALAAVFFVFTASSLGAQTSGQVGERAQGMGGAFVAVADDASAIYWNPAGLANVFKFDAELNFTSQGQPPDTAGAPKPARAIFAGAAIAALGLATYHVRTAVSASKSRQNEGSGQVRVSTLATENVGVSLVQTLVKTVVIGSTLRAVNGAGSTAFDLDLGVMAASGDIRVGAAVRNLRQSLDLMRQARVGVAWVPRNPSAGVYGPFSLAFDADLTKTPGPSGERREAAIGSEQWWEAGVLGTRVGVQWSTLNDAKPAVSGGLSVKFPHSLFLDGHITKGKGTGNSGWGVGARMTF